MDFPSAYYSTATFSTCASGMTNPLSHGFQMSKRLLYCTTTTLDRYPLHLDKIYYTQMVTFLYICGMDFYNPQHHHFHLSSSAPIIFYFHPTFTSIQHSLPSNIHFHPTFTSIQHSLPSKPTYYWAASSAHFHKPSSMCVMALALSCGSYHCRDKV